MKSLVVYINTMNASGGIERVVANLVARWNQKYAVTLLVKDDGSSFYPLPENLPIVSIDEPLLLDMNDRASRVLSVAGNLFKTVRKLGDFIRKHDFDYLYTVTPLNSLELFLASRTVMKKTVISEHASAFAVNRVYQKIKRIVYPKAYCISVPNRMDCDVYKAWGCNTVYIPHLSTYQAQAFHSKESKILLNVGRLTSDKRQIDLLRTWGKIEEKNGWELLIVGSGEEKERLLAAIKQEDIRSVKLLEHTNSIQDIYREAAAFVLTSRMEGFGMVLLEAMAFGVPCISFDCPSGPRDIIQDGYNGFLVENDDFSAMTEKLKEVLYLDQKELDRLSFNALETVKQWDADSIMSAWDNVFA